MKLAFDKLNQHQIIIQRRETKPVMLILRENAQTQRFHFIFICFPRTLYGDRVEDELWIKLNKYLIALFCNVSIP